MVTKKKKPAHKGKSKQSPKHVYAVSVTCACDRDITEDELAQIYPSQKLAKIQKFLPEINSTFTTYSIKSCLCKIHFLSQVGHESGQLNYVAEILAKGHTEEKDYKGYKGRGLIQLTSKANYEAYGKAAVHDFLGAHKVELEEPKWATDSAGWFWTQGVSEHDLNDSADKNDFIRITQLINGAFNGYNDRKAYVKRAAKVLRLDICPNQNKPIDVENYVFTDSDSYDSELGAFAWGYWHDSKSSKSGVTKDDDKAKAGYTKYLEFASVFSKKKKSQGARFNIMDGKKKGTMQTMVDIATNRLTELSKAP